MRVLVVEDDKALGLFLQKGLLLAGHEVEWVGTGELALERVSERQPALIVLDLGLPGLDGFEVLKRVRSVHPEVSVLVLSGRSDVEERIRCLESGAHDCVMKPFSFQELIARCTGILRRREEQHRNPVVTCGPLELDLLARTVRHAGREVELTTKEFELLEYLMRHPGQACGRGELLREVWRLSPETTTNIVDVYVNYLRRKLEPVGGALPRNAVIETVRGLGYRLNMSLPAKGVQSAAQRAKAVA